MAGENVDRITLVISQVPRGKVATYGQIARLAGIPKNARQVGRVLRDLNDKRVPWFRIVNSRGEISSRGTPEIESSQREALMEEGVEFDSAGRVSLVKFGWNPEE